MATIGQRWKGFLLTISQKRISVIVLVLLVLNMSMTAHRKTSRVGEEECTGSYAKWCNPMPFNSFETQFNSTPTVNRSKTNFTMASITVAKDQHKTHLVSVRAQTTTINHLKTSASSISHIETSKTRGYLTKKKITTAPSTAQTRGYLAKNRRTTVFSTLQTIKAMPPSVYSSTEASDQEIQTESKTETKSTTDYTSPVSLTAKTKTNNASMDFTTTSSTHTPEPITTTAADSNPLKLPGNHASDQYGGSTSTQMPVKRCKTFGCIGAMCYTGVSVMEEQCGKGLDHCELKKTTSQVSWNQYVSVWSAGCCSNCKQQTKCSAFSSFTCHQECCEAAPVSCLKLDALLNVPISAVPGLRPPCPLSVGTLSLLNFLLSALSQHLLL